MPFEIGPCNATEPIPAGMRCQEATRHHTLEWCLAWQQKAGISILEG